MGNLVYPALPGLLFPQGRAVLPPKVRIRTTPSQREYRSRDARLPRYQYSLAYEFLRTGRRGSELASLVGFYNQVGGPFDSWLYLDPDDNSVSGQQFGTGDGATAAFQLVRSFGAFSEPVFDVAGSPSVYIADWQGTSQVLPSARTNYVLQSSTFDAAVWTKDGCSVSPNTNLAPDGSVTGDYLVEGSGTGAGHKCYQTFTTTQSATFVVSFYLLAGARSVGQMWSWGGSTSDTTSAFFNTATGVATGTGSPSMVNIGGGWWRCSRVISTVPGQTQLTIGIGPSDGSGVQVYAGDGASGISLWGAQLEAARTTPTRYIPTAATAVTTIDYTLGSGGVVAFASPPASGAALTWSGQFYRRCRFLGDRLDTEKFMADLFAAKRVDFISVKG